MNPCTIDKLSRYLALVALPFAAACSDPPAPKSPPISYVAPPRPAPAPPPSPPAQAAATPVVLDPSITTACGIPQPKSFFAFDSAVLRQSDESGLSGVATCFRDGPLKGKRMEIAGRADPRGTEEYNQTLGASRAGAVSRFLTGSGVRKDTISTVSTGEDLAKGTDEAGWADDRRVDIKLSE